MELSTEIFQELVGGGKLSPQSGNAELRTVPRFQATVPVTLLLLNGDKQAKPMPATVRDLSTRGVGIEFSEPIHANTAFAIRLQRRDGSPLWLHYISARWSPIDGKIYSVGAKFTGMSAPKTAQTS